MMLKTIPEQIKPMLEQVLPAQDSIFRAFDLSPPESAKVVILGQDPYPTPGDANGLAFSVPERAVNSTVNLSIRQKDRY